ncbi:E3 ubiquitin-protein ligase RZFP34 isoform X2 [Cynara cardunculus var. scolymus]|uniref:E3 ubiquitin-protein ligase RZFP34 isoform X2 n=1 Tax=Cynara cardunculus var. scolymus TaxID=59895 RepID=UPI000D625724|nr:E3 ubiquitin-protein ligase RZFP34 isoform X2 [Cynara cardunculus var. scolymus]
MESQVSVPHVQVANEDEPSVEVDGGNFGCTHYRRRCKIKAPCCDEVFDCRHCHNEIKNSLEIDPIHRHDVPRHDVKKVICSLCDTEQDVQQNCISCGVCMGNYFCQTCKFYDNDVSKNQYHCDQCGICRTGGKENFFHCDKCGCCYSKAIKDTHVCVERAMHHDCPVCSEFLFDTLKDLTMLPCGHTMHLGCLKEMEQHHRYSCPICSKSICDLSDMWRKLDNEVEATPMPETYKNKMVWILCNDCEKISRVKFHIVGQKCTQCKSYNTRQIRGGPSSSVSCTSSVSDEDVN